ncbi:MAG: L-idonate 5-dehydrogenase [Pseudomonadota bacterium]
MRAVVLHSAGDLRVEDRAAPAAEDEGVRVRIEAGGICGSDLHYYQHGGFGTTRVREPVILGHEVAGTVLSAPAGSAVAAGDAVALSPSRPCGTCAYCRAGLKIHCENMRFYGSAMPMPHIQGAFRDEIVALPEQCFRLGIGTSVQIGAFAEPLAVVLHARRRAGSLAGKRVLITGCGPIGALAILAAREAEASEIVVTDIVEEVLRTGAVLGADRVINVAEKTDWAKLYARGKGYFDVMFEATGNAAALRDGMETLRPRAVLMQVGLGGNVTIPQNTVVTKELDVRGAFRFHEEFGEAVDALTSGRIDVVPLLTRSFRVEDVVEAFRFAGDRRQSMKVQLDFTA